MFKKILIPSFAFFGISLIALYAAAVEPVVPNDKKEVLEETYEPVVVLELFTSQGCSSCPPADVLLNKAKKQFPETVFALSYHVDYWNYIGWKDPFSKSVYTKKQRDYNRKFRYSSNYTPEMVVNGREHFVGSNASKLFTKVDAYKNRNSANKVLLTNVKQSGGTIDFEYSVLGDVDTKLLRTVLVLDERTTSVTRGENRNRTLKNSNIVVAEDYIPLSAREGKGVLSVPEIVRGNDKLTLIALVEADNLDITAAAKVGLD
ncbi:DUF1223 domain-containing protein [Flagellimonas flava]|uniref:DUF1223 domain-containing protein n=1 Tax=Flagellimonas flava TaxID=570519 RepID=A0A1M5Q5U8_9FLAO|nr:DUF1223 domain-containing protein [Allomuricauda flava]SHH09637.1 Protein of unknown function [Allomuricauda flava]